MGCNIIKDKLLDYIDGNLNKEEERKIKEHLSACAECYKEYMELKSTIAYIKDGANIIDTSKELTLSPKMVKKKAVRSFTRTGLIAVILSLMLVATVFATEIFDFMKWWKKSSERQISAWEKLIENGVGQKLNISVTDQNIRVTAEGVIADDFNTIILLKIEDLEGNIRFVPGRDTANNAPLAVGGDIKRIYEEISFPLSANYSPLYVEDENTAKLMVYTFPMSKDEGKIEIYINELMSFINESKESQVRVAGNWNMTIPAKKLKSKIYLVDEEIDLGGNELTIERITIAPTTTRIHYKLQVYDEENRRFIDDISFLVKCGRKTYGRSELSRGGAMEYKSFGVVRREFDIESLYLEEPKEIALIVNTCRYTSRGQKKYHIDWDNLPQVIEYDNSKITIEDIKYNEDSAEIIIKEDDRKDRKYIRSNIYLKIKDVIKEIHDGAEYTYRDEYLFYGNPIEYEIRDSKGKVKDEENISWTDEMYVFAFKQKITLSPEDFRRQGLSVEDFKEYLIPDELYIDGQEYIEFPNIKVNIKLDK